MSIQCSVGKALREPCNIMEGLFDYKSWNEDRSSLLLQRVEAQTMRRLYDLDSCCMLHYTNFIVDYRSYQLRHGCCNPLLEHLCSVPHDLHLITSEICHGLDTKYPFMLEERYICQTCLIKINEKQPAAGTNVDHPPEILEQYTYDNVTDIYNYTLQHHSHPMYEFLKQEQAEVIHSLLMKKDTLCVLATGVGKTAAIILPGLIKSKLSKTRHITVMVCPMNVIINEQLLRLECQHLKGSVLAAENRMDDIMNQLGSVGNCEPYYLLCYPETLELAWVRKLLVKLSKEISYVMVDEAHTLYDWSTTFRPAFGKIGKVRVFLECTIGLFTATFTNGMKAGVLDACRLGEDDMQVIAKNPDRPEIFLDLQTKTNFAKDLDFLIKEAEQKGIGMKRTIVFLRSTNETSDMNYKFRTSLQNGGRVIRDGKLFDYLTDHISSNIGPVTQQRIMQLFSSRENCLQILFSTIFYGMGLDNPTIERVILYDCDDNVASIFQKIGRVRRQEGRQGQAVIFATKSMRNKIFHKNVCVRKCLLQNLMGYTPVDAIYMECECMTNTCKCYKCKCCSVCLKSCKCASGSQMVLDNSENVIGDEYEEMMS